MLDPFATDDAAGIGMDWYYVKDGAQEGPVTEADLEELARDGIVRGDTLVWRPGLQEWQPAYDHVAGVTPPPVTQRDTSLPEGVPGNPREAHASRGAAANHRGAEGPDADYTAQSGFVDAAKKFFGNYATFSGRSNRGEFWFWVLDNLAISLLVSFVLGDTGSSLWSLVTLIPSFALGARRLHDIGRSGWWQLLILLPVVGLLVLIYWFAQRPEPGPNRYG
ncbi:DUF805 domain-containing protein [Roseivivax marinus]|uniref:DUF805 domain-containing protein n=1 Tax=Roseivivax marinus TaxID=1379903 RepID=UPI00273FFA7A|nr:DUF805 domain-containing protein [Roseivivax marinus]